MKTVFALLTLTLFASSALAEVRENGGRMAPAAAKVVFFSPGDGIDNQLKASVDALILEYKDAGLVKVLTEKRWGREGEVTLCVELVDLDSSRRLNAQLAELLKTGEGKTRLEFAASCEEKKVVGPFERK